MFNRISLTLAATFFVAMAGAKSNSPQMEHNSFLNKPVFNSKSLAAQVGADSTVQKRYEKHFMMNKAAIQSYFTDLTLQPLNQTRRYLVYNVDKNLHIQHRMLLIQKGTLVFVDRKGKPILRRSCGNPMVAYIPPKGQVAINFAPPKFAAASTEAAEEPIVFSEAMEPEPIIETAVPPTATPVVEPLAPALPPLPIVAAAPTLGWLPILGLIPIIDGGHDNGDSIPPVPEPMGFAVLALGVGSLLLRRRRA